MEDSEEATDGQSEVHGVSNHLTKSLTLTKVGSSKNSDALSDATTQEAPPEVISIFNIFFWIIFDIYILMKLLLLVNFWF